MGGENEQQNKPELRAGGGEVSCISMRSMSRLVDRGELKAVRVGAFSAFRTEDVLSMIGQSGDSGIGLPSEALLSLNQVAGRLNCAPDDVRTLTARGDLTQLMVGHCKRWSPVEIAGLHTTEGVS